MQKQQQQQQQGKQQQQKNAAAAGTFALCLLLYRVGRHLCPSTPQAAHLDAAHRLGHHLNLPLQQLHVGPGTHAYHHQGRVQLLLPVLA